jgi:hypothetical protein
MVQFRIPALRILKRAMVEYISGKLSANKDMVSRSEAVLRIFVRPTRSLVSRGFIARQFFLLGVSFDPKASGMTRRIILRRRQLLRRYSMLLTF